MGTSSEKTALRRLGKDLDYAQIGRQCLPPRNLYVDFNIGVDPIAPFPGLAKTELALFESTMRPNVQTQRADPLTFVVLGVLRPLVCGKAANCRSQNDAAPEIVASGGLLGHHNHTFRKAL